MAELIIVFACFGAVVVVGLAFIGFCTVFSL
jgi:hypothetical protein